MISIKLLYHTRGYILRVFTALYKTEEGRGTCEQNEEKETRYLSLFPEKVK